MKYIIALDQGTTSSRSVLFNEHGDFIDMVSENFPQIYPKSGWVEHDPQDILVSVLNTFFAVLERNHVSVSEVLGVGITNQRETTVVWNRHTGIPVYNAIVWQDTRTKDTCETLKTWGFTKHIKKTTGLVIEPYFSATKIAWILNNVKDARKQAECGDLLFGTIDTWLLWNLTERKVHATDYSNASRTTLFDIQKLDWDDTLLKALNIPRSLMPAVFPSSHHFGDMTCGIPIMGILGDQQAALFGQACFERGMSKNTYGTGCFMLMNIGEEIQYSERGLLTTIAWGLNGKVTYALEGSVFIGGAAVSWLRDEMRLIKKSSDVENFCLDTSLDNPVYFVPTFAGLGTPYWDMKTQGSIFGLTRDTGRNHIMRATLEAIAYQVNEVLVAMQEDSGITLTVLNVDGGACVNNFLMQFQADILDIPVYRPEVVESTALGIAYLTGITLELWSMEDLTKKRKLQKIFTPTYTQERREKLKSKWHQAIACARLFAKE